MSQLAPSDTKGSYKRPTSSLSSSNADNRISNNEPNNEMNLYIGTACPWCHRVTLSLALLNATPNYTVHTVQPGDNGLWRLPSALSKSTGKQLLKDIYLDSDSSYTGRFTAPLLHNLSTNTLISNESSQLVNYLSCSHSNSRSSIDLSLSSEHNDENLCEQIHANINDGVYRAGFATTQQAYDIAEANVFETLDLLEKRLHNSKFLCSDHVVSQADVILFPTVYRFDAVYSPIFKLTRKCIRNDYPMLSIWLRRMYHLDGVSDTCASLQDICQQYFGRLFPLNASGIVPNVPTIDLSPLPPSS